MNADAPPQLGPLVQAERKARRLTLEQLAARSGVSKSMLSQIERGEANPTFAVLWGLTRALNLDLSDLVGGVSRQQPDIELVSLAHTPEIRSPKGDWHLRILSPPNLASQVEWYELELAAGCTLSSAAHPAGTMEHLTAWTEGLTVTSGTTRESMKRGETARYRADVPHQIFNDGRIPARALMVVLYRQ